MVPSNDHYLEAYAHEHRARETGRRGSGRGAGPQRHDCRAWHRLDRGVPAPALAKRSLDIVCAATSPRTEHAARELGLRIEDVTSIDWFDIAIDGADQIAPDGWLVKGGGGAHTREKVLAGAADRFVVIADSSKPVPALHAPVPLELLSFGLRATMRRAAPASLRDVPLSPDGGVIADYHGPVQDPAALAVRLSSTPGVVEHGLFPPHMVATILIGRGNSADRIDFTPGS